MPLTATFCDEERLLDVAARTESVWRESRESHRFHSRKGTSVHHNVVGVWRASPWSRRGHHGVGTTGLLGH